MGHDVDERAIISKLFVREERIVERLMNLVSLSEDILNIVEETGEVHINELYNLNNSEKTFLLTIGTYFAWKAGLSETPEVSLSVLSSRLGVPVTTLSAPLNKLINEEKLILKVGRGSYVLNHNNYIKIKNYLQILKERINHEPKQT